MSFAVEGVSAPGTGAQAAIARIAELQSLVARAHGIEPVASAPAAAGTTSFSSALAGAGVGQALSSAAPAPFAAGPAPLTAAPVGSGQLGGTPTQYDGLILAAAQKHGIDPALLKGLIRAESNFDPNAGSPAGAGGLVQLMPGTAASLGVTDRFDPAQSIDGGARYLRQQLDAFDGDVTLALAAYNAGPGAVQRYGGVPPYAETQAYVQKVQQYADEYRVAPSAPALAGGPAAPLPAAMPAAVLPTAIPTTGSGSIT